MSDILEDLSAPALVKAIEDNLSAWVPELGKMGRFTANEPLGINRSIVEIPNALFNSIMDARLDSEKVEMTIQSVIADAKVRKVPLLWWIGPSTKPADLSLYLIKSGFNVDDDGPGMAVQLENLNERLPLPQGVTIKQTKDDLSLWEWSQTLAAGFEVSPDRIDFMINSWHHFINIANPETCLTYLAYLDGKPVATSLLFLQGGVAGIYAVSTIPEARRKGIGSQVTLHPLLLARSMGYKAGILQASEMGKSVYQALGFKEYCWIQSYRYTPK